MKKVLLTTAALLVATGFHCCTRLSAGQSTPNATFEYRDIHLPKHDNGENKKLSLNSLDDDWGIWGHNLSVVLPDNVSKQVFAKVRGGIKADQFCFSSSKLYDYIVDYVKGNYMFKSGMNFAILPNDNSVVCLCTECVRAGNSEGNASPAVSKLIEKLAKKFPEHNFFTSYYSTTSEIPAEKMPVNTGVWVSAMDYPLAAIETPKEKEFINLLKQWSAKTENVYVWDYINNFDDYFTPFPVFTIMQRRFRQYRDAGVQGIFLNGSGSDYSTFSRLKKAVLAQLMINPDQDWEELLRHYAQEYYPVSGNDIANFIVAQERMVAENGKKLPFYAGVDVARKTYLPEREFVDFYNRLVRNRRNAEAQEQKEIDSMLNAMALTMLEVKRLNNDLDSTENLRARLAKLPAQGINYYNEGCWSIDRYLQQYQRMEEDARETAQTNLLKGVALHPRVPLDEDYQDISIVTDGLLGIPSNYHNGNLITSADPAFSLSIPRVPGMSKLKVWMVYNPGFKIGLPEEVYVMVNGLKYKAQVPDKPHTATGHSFLEFNIPPQGDIILSLKKDPEVKTMAIDEIQAF